MICLICKKEIKTRGAKKYCSMACYNTVKIGGVVGRKLSSKSKKIISNKIKEKWLLGIYNSRNSNFYKGMTPYNKGKKLPEISGENHYNWKKGISKDINHWNRIRRNRKLKSKGNHNKEQWEELKKYYNYMCLCCKQQEPFIRLTEDHIIPLSIGGDDDIKNIQPLCQSCNSRKYNKIINFKELIQK